MKLSNEAKQGIMALATGARILQAGHMANKVRKSQGIAIDMAVFLALDAADGMIARKLEIDDKARRTVDAYVDRFSMAINFGALLRRDKRALPYVAALGVKEAIVGVASASNYANTGEVIRGRGLNKLAPLSVAAFGMAANNDKLYKLTGATMVGINALLAVDYVNHALNGSKAGYKDEHDVFHLPGFSGTLELLDCYNSDND